MKQLLSPTAVAEIKGCALRTVQRAIHSGALPSYAVIGPNGEPSAYGIDPDVLGSWGPDKTRQDAQRSS